MVTARKLSVAEAARRLGVPESRLHDTGGGRPPSRTVPPSPSPGHQTLSDEEETRRLEAEVKRLEVERDILKKATEFFAALTKSPSRGLKNAATSTRWRRGAAS